MTDEKDIEKIVANIRRLGVEKEGCGHEVWFISFVLTNLFGQISVIQHILSSRDNSVGLLAIIN